MATIQQNFTDSNTITIALASLGYGSLIASSAIDNSTNKYVSATIQGKITTTSTIPVGTVTLFLLRSVDGGTTYDDIGVLSPDWIMNMQPLLNIDTPDASTTYVFSFNTLSTGTLPSFWKIVVWNNSGGALSATVGDHYVMFTGNKYESI